MFEGFGRVRDYDEGTSDKKETRIYKKIIDPSERARRLGLLAEPDIKDLRISREEMKYRASALLSMVVGLQDELKQDEPLSDLLCKTSKRLQEIHEKAGRWGSHRMSTPKIKFELDYIEHEIMPILVSEIKKGHEIVEDACRMLSEAKKAERISKGMEHHSKQICKDFQKKIKKLEEAFSECRKAENELKARSQNRDIEPDKKLN